MHKLNVLEIGEFASDNTTAVWRLGLRKLNRMKWYSRMASIITLSFITILCAETFVFVNALSQNINQGETFRKLFHSARNKPQLNITSWSCLL